MAKTGITKYFSFYVLAIPYVSFLYLTNIEAAWWMTDLE